MIYLLPFDEPSVHKPALAGINSTRAASPQNGNKQLLDQLNPNIPVSGRLVMMQLLQAVWFYIVTVWTLHNTHLYNNAGQFSLPNYLQAIQTHYKLGAQLPQMHKMHYSNDFCCKC